MSDSLLDELFRCEEDVHAVTPADPLDPSGSACMCGAITMIGVVAAVKGGSKVFFHYLIDTTPVSDDEADDDLDPAYHAEQAFRPR